MQIDFYEKLPVRKKKLYVIGLPSRLYLMKQLAHLIF